MKTAKRQTEKLEIQQDRTKNIRTADITIDRFLEAAAAQIKQDAEITTNKILLAGAAIAKDRISQIEETLIEQLHKVSTRNQIK